VPTIAEQIFQGEQASIESAKGDLSTAVQLGLKVEQAKQNRAKLEQAKLMVSQKTNDNLFKALDRISKAKTAPEKKFYQEQAKNAYTQAQPEGNPRNLDLLFASDDLRQQSVNAYFGSEAEAAGINPERIAFLKQAFSGDEVGFEKAVTEQIDQANLEKRARIKAEGELAKEKRKLTQKEKERFTIVTSQLAKDVKSDFNKLDEQAGATRSAHDSLSDIVKGFEAGQESSKMEVLFNASGRSIAKTFNSGAMKDRDVADFKELSGLKEISAKLVRQYVTGGVSEENAVQLFALTKRIAKRIDHEKAVKAARFRDRFNIPEFEGREDELRKASGLDASLTPTLEFVPPKAETFVLKDVSNITADTFNSYDEAKQKRFADKLKTTVEEIKSQLGIK
jgi:hypothetical protein